MAFLPNYTVYSPAVFCDVLGVHFTMLGAFCGLLFFLTLIFRARFQNRKIYLVSLILSFLLFVTYFMDFSTVYGNCGDRISLSYGLLPSNIIPEWLQEWLKQIETNRLYDISI